MPFDTVFLENQTWHHGVTLVVVMGNGTPPEANNDLGNKFLRLGERWEIESDGLDIYYRRDTDPDHPTGDKTLWIHRPCYGNGSIYHERV